MCQDQNDARRLLGGVRIDGFDHSLANRSFDDKPVGGALLHFEGVASSAGYFESPVDAIERLSDDALRASGVERRRPDG
jgi:hypothetical protein